MLNCREGQLMPIYSYLKWSDIEIEKTVSPQLYSVEDPIKMDIKYRLPYFALFLVVILSYLELFQGGRAESKCSFDQISKLMIPLFITLSSDENCLNRWSSSGYLSDYYKCKKECDNDKGWYSADLRGNCEYHGSQCCRNFTLFGSITYNTLYNPTYPGWSYSLNIMQPFQQENK